MRLGSGEVPRIALGCDTMVALGEAARQGHTIFAKNSDRPPGECQPLVLVERAEHPPGTSVRCQYVEIGQVRETCRVLGSQPVWLWGFEHGVNEYGLAVGNETIFGREPAAATGLLGMDLVRLALERATRAEQALQILIDLIEEHGQGGSGFRELEFPYDNSFLVADPREAWILEAFGRTWAARRCRPTDAITNHITIGQDWDRLSPDAEDRARSLGFAATSPFDFAAAFRESEKIPPVMSEGRLRRSRGLLERARGDVTLATLREILRDHDASGARFVRGASPEEAAFHTICMHQGVARTAASIIAELDDHRRGPQMAWTSFGRPCAAVFFPVIAAGALPRAFRDGSDEPSDALWWVFERLATAVEDDPGASARVRESFDALEADLAAMWEGARPALESIVPGGDERPATEFMQDVAARVEAAARALLAACTTRR
jgi:dipeptidase